MTRPFICINSLIMDIENNNSAVMSGKNTFNMENIVRNIAKSEGYDKYEAEFKFHPIAEQGFLGTTCEVDIKDASQEANIFLKILNPNDGTTFLKVPEVYVRELFVYRDLANVYREFQEEFSVPKGERYKFVRSYADSSPTVIILDNMAKRGYKTYHRSATVSMDFAILAIKELAKFHALSFALKKKRPKYFEQYVATINHSYIFNEDWANFVDTFLDITKRYVNKDVRGKLDVFKETFVKKYQYFLEEDKFKCCLCHGDYRPCNILTKELNSKPTDVIPIDYQLIYYGCPAMDLIYFIYTSLDQKMRQNIPFLKDTYYNSLKTFLTYFKMDINDVIPRNIFEVMFKERLVYGLQISLLVMPILMMPDDNLSDLATLTTVEHETDDQCQERVIGIINDFIELGYL